ncbi:YafY family transcriptional regulator [Rhodocaloribacter litoris]|uniref:helix-turn-helix transcriptional regulator n=1 Tax=Rhodocaloribacter litoris TaxID=2558931 RepID=UPI001422177E|nr:YafY family protein [Rhodocaloribacter litoris]QXD13722.1 YafY family transcriptional regulator [Rhodocaloribacter litoris]
MSNDERRVNRTERLFATILLLQNRPNMTSRDLAEHFGVSRRTIFRDLRALSESGVPLTYAEGGGYEILEGYQLPPLMLTAREAATLLVGTEFMKLQSDASLREDADAVALKIRSVLPREIREYIDRLRDRTVLDPYWLHAVQQEEEEEGRWYRLSEAVARQRAVIMEYYVESRDELTRRRVDPLGLVYYTDHWNLIAFDHLREDIRNFRLDRIRSMHVLMERFEWPEGFDLARHLEERGAGTASRRITLRFSKRAYRRARQAIPARIEEERPCGDEIEVTFYFENLDYVAGWLLRYGAEAYVVEPAPLRERVLALAEAMTERYRTAETGEKA